MQIFDRCDSFLRFYEFGDQLHRTGPVERDQRDDVVQLFHIELLRQTGHPSRFHLEKTNRLAPVVEIESRFVVERNVLE